MNEYIVPWDIAKKVDRLAGMIFRRTPELINDPSGRSRSIEYLDLLLIEQHSGLSYPAMADRIAEIQANVNLDRNSDLLIDSTGVGEAVVDLLQAKGLSPIKIIFTGGDRPHEIQPATGQAFSHDSRALMRAPVGWNVPRKDLVAAGKVILEQNRLRVGKRVKHADLFREQLEGFKLDKKGKRYEAETEELHDDLVIDFLMASWLILQSRTDLSKHDVPAEQETKAPEWDPLSIGG